MDAQQIKQQFSELREQLFVKIARESDQHALFPADNLDAIKKAGLQAILVPKEYGGAGLSFKNYQECLVEIAKGCAATAAAFNMHNIVVGSLTDIITNQNILPEVKARISPYIESLFKEIVEKKVMIAAATTEPGVGARFSQIKTHFQRDNHGYRLNGKKSFVTMANYADYFLVLARKWQEPANETHETASLTYFLAPRDTPGITIHSDWDTIGMRGTASYEIEFKNVWLDRDSVFMGREGFALSKVIQEPHWISGGYLGVYLGIMEAAFEFTQSYLKQRSDYQLKTGLAFQPLIQARLGDMYVILNNARNAVFHAAESVVQKRGTLACNQAIYAAKYYLGEMAPRLTALAIRTCGGSTIHKKFNLERYYRDSVCGGLMPLVTDMCQIFLGKTALGLEIEDIW